MFVIIALVEQGNYLLKFIQCPEIHFCFLTLDIPCLLYTSFLEQFCDLLVVILIIAALISMVSGNVESTVVILAVIILNAILGTVQHAKAEKSLDSLKSLSSPDVYKRQPTSLPETSTQRPRRRR